MGKTFLPVITQMVTKITEFIKLSQSPEFKNFIKNVPQFEGVEGSFISGGYLRTPGPSTPQSEILLDPKTGIIGPPVPERLKNQGSNN